MADEQVPAEMAKPEGETPPTTQPASETPAGDAPVSELTAELEETRKALKKANAEAAKRRKALDAFEAAEKERADAELSEMDRLQKQLAERESELNTLRMNDLKRRIAADIGLPDALALRLQGADEDELKEDAAALLKTLPKKTAPTLQPTNPGGNAQPGTETLEQRRARIRQDGTNIFDPGSAVKRGGGVRILNSGG